MSDTIDVDEELDSSFEDALLAAFEQEQVAVDSSGDNTHETKDV